jgi:hypothetical protein
MIRLATLLALGMAIGALGQAQQSFLLIPDWDNDRVCAFSPVDGSLINANFIPTNTTLFALALSTHCRPRQAQSSCPTRLNRRHP